MTRITLFLALCGLVAASCSSDDSDATVGTSVPESAPTSAPQPAAATSPPASETTAPEPEPTAPPEPAPAPEAGTVHETPPADGGFAAIGPMVSEFVDAEGLNGAALVVVERDRGVVHEEYWGEFTADRVSLIASSSKMITAGVLLRLQDDGLIDLDAPLTEAVAWASDHPDLTARQLVSNSSGLVGLGPNPVYAPYICQWWGISELETCAEGVLSTTGDDGDVLPPDTEFRYGGAQWQVAGGVAEAVSGRSWAELIDEIYVQPCGVTSLGYGNHFESAGGFTYPLGFDPAGQAPTDNPNMEGGAFIDPLDYASLLLMQLRGGACPDGQVVSPEAVVEWHSDRVATYGDAGDPDTGYGMGWWVDRESGVITDPGAYGSFPWLDVEAGYGAYLVIEADSNTGIELGELLIPVVEGAVVGQT